MGAPLFYVDAYGLFALAIGLVLMIVNAPAIFEGIAFRLWPWTTKAHFFTSGNRIRTKLLFKPIDGALTLEEKGVARTWFEQQMTFYREGRNLHVYLPADSASTAKIYEPATLISPEALGNCVRLARQEGIMIHKNDEKTIATIKVLVVLGLVASVLTLALELFKMSKQQG